MQYEREVFILKNECTNGSRADVLDKLNKILNFEDRIIIESTVVINYINNQFILSLDSFVSENLIEENGKEYAVKEKIEKAIAFTTELQSYAKNLAKNNFDLLLQDDYNEKWQKFFVDLKTVLATLSDERAPEIIECLEKRIKSMETIEGQIKLIANNLRAAILTIRIESYKLFCQFHQIYIYFAHHTKSDLNPQFVAQKFDNFNRNLDEYLKLLSSEEKMVETKEIIDSYESAFTALCETLSDLPSEILTKISE